MRAVLDTNVIVSAVLSSAGPPDSILRAWRGGSFHLVTSAPLLLELADVLARPHIRRRTGFSAAETAELVQMIADSAMVVEPTEAIDAVPGDAADNRLLEAAVAARADFIVSGDKRVLELESFRESAIVTPARFLALLTTASEAP